MDRSKGICCPYHWLNYHDTPLVSLTVLDPLKYPVSTLRMLEVYEIPVNSY